MRLINAGPILQYISSRMQPLIDSDRSKEADELWGVYCEIITAPSVFTSQEYHITAADSPLQITKDLIKNNPPTMPDVAEIVRCERCNYWKPFTSGRFILSRGMCKYHHINTHKVDFCSCGEVANQVEEGTDNGKDR